MRINININIPEFHNDDVDAENAISNNTIRINRNCNINIFSIRCLTFFLTPTSGHWEWGNGPKPRPGSQKGVQSAPFASCSEGTMGVKLVIDVADDTAMPFSSILEDLIIVEYGSLMDGMDPNNAGNPHALAAHMCMCWCMDICTKGLHNILAESFSLLATPTMPIDGLPLHEDTRSKLHEDAILSQERQRCTALAQVIYSAKSDLQMV
ncbi:uncharacterized protein BJ212DRAFT_1304403 [Suillus subaureus]|uniref:Uncharacterized protein n=1 Tax=Suillus subaureus TaxID=48587 RepID=A0A9P7DVY1_9AGAM|nr:uncharacterized protein BJ212DRAFT_1304403 [Suillus subaureus]KAG1804193.1 hypothetical protein BJ212DRAFT_1304403 [Suillus subaureus]